MGAAEAATTRIDWIAGAMLGLDFPAHADALAAGGAEFLTRAFHAAGALPLDNAVARITQFVPWIGGGTGAKALLAVEYARPDPALPTDLFVKFSRNFDDPIYDRARHLMIPEVKLALLSRTPGFPIAVPTCMFADFEAVTGTAILVTQRIAYGTGTIERHYPKCMDHELPDAIGHYRAYITALARLAGAHRAGRLPAYVADQFPFDLEAAIASNRNPYDAQRVANRIARYADFAARYPQLLPANIRTPEFLASLGEGAALLLANEEAVSRHLFAQPDFIALCHWNANIDNGWFWRDEAGDLQCGLMDWGGVGQIHLGMVIWGCLSGVETWMWDAHLDEIIALFVAEYHAAGGPAVDVAELKRHVLLYAGIMGLAWLMDAPPRILAEAPNLADCAGPTDPHITANETPRVQLLMMTNFMHLWQSNDITGLLRDLVGN